ncbi:MAG: hypothetical protein ABJA34_08585 [Pseudonocardiales bacterium]
MPDDPQGPRVEDPWLPDDTYSHGEAGGSDGSTDAKDDSEPFWRSESWLLEPLTDDPKAPSVNTDFDWGSGGGSLTDAPPSHDEPASWETSPFWESPVWDTNSTWESAAPTESADVPAYDQPARDTSGFEAPASDDRSSDNAPDSADRAPQPATDPEVTGGYETAVAYDNAATYEPTAAYDGPAAIDWDALGKDDDDPVGWNDLYAGDTAEKWPAFSPESDDGERPAETGESAAERPSPLRDNPHHEKGLEPRAVSANATDFAAQKTATTNDDPPNGGLPAAVYRFTGGHVRLKPSKEERRRRRCEDDIRRSIAGLRQITFTNPKGGSGKTTAALLTSITLGQLRGGYILAWDNNETQGTLGVRARPDHHANTVRDLIADLPSFSGPVPGRVGDLAKYIRSQGDAMYDVLASDEQATAGEMMTAAAFQAVREVVGRFYKLICVDTGNNVRAANWAAAIDSTDQLVVTSSVRWESAYSASRMLDYLEQSGRGDLVANAVTVLTMPRSIKGLNLPQVETHFSVRTREVLHAPFDPQLDNGDQIRMSRLSEETRQAWLEIAAAIARGL